MFVNLRLEEVYLKTLKRIKVESAEKKEYIPDLEASFGRNSPPIQPNCRLLKTNPTGVPKRIKIELWNIENVSFHLNIVEKNMALAKRRQPSFAYRGPLIGIDNNLNTITSYGLSLKQSHYSDQDEKTNCINYPSKIFNSFQDCDEEFVIEEVQKIGVMPFWATKGNFNLTSSM